MLIFKEASRLQQHLRSAAAQGHAIGFVPTMGALHAGHLKLIDASKKGGHYTVCSIFVNPTQFNNKEDFEKYPISVESDLEQLLSAQCDVLFLPSVEEIYPAQWQKGYYNLGHLETVLEGAHRPGHFQGVCQVVDRLLQIVQPHTLFLGEKDRQQCAVLQRLLELKPQHQTKLSIVPTQRETDGLAMSSRNRRLGAEDRKKAAAIYEALLHIKTHYRKKEDAQLLAEAQSLLTHAGFVVDYVSIADAATLLPVQPQTTDAVALIAASLGSVRLIDNTSL